MAPSLQPYFTMRAYLSQTDGHDLKAIKAGPVRSIVPITSGFITGSGLEAQITPGGGDWILLNPVTNVAHLDVRTQARTADGHSVYVHYTGILGQDAAALKVLGWKADAKTTQYGDHKWFSGPIMETSDPKFKWVEDSLWVGEGRFVVDEKGSAVEYQIYKVDN